MKLLSKYRMYDLVLIALMAALGIATKPIVVPLAHMISGPLLIPGGAIAGGLYMFWIVLAAGLVDKRGAATLTALVQALMVLVMGSFGSHGIMSIITYTLPGLMIDVIFIICRRRVRTNLNFFAAGIIANLSGTYLSNLVFFRLPLVPLIMSLSSGILSGGVGGLIAYATYKQIKRMDRSGEEGDADNEEILEDRK